MNIRAAILRPLDATKHQVMTVQITNNHYVEIFIADAGDGRAAKISVALRDIQNAVGDISYKDVINIIDSTRMDIQNRFAVTAPGAKPTYLNQSYYEGYTAALADLRATIQRIMPE